MATVQRGKHYEVFPNSIDLFGLHGGRNNKYWTIGLAVSAEQRSYLLAAVSPTSILDDVLALIQRNVMAGKYPDIKSVAMGARQAVILFLEGVLTSEHFISAEEGALDMDGGATLSYIRLANVAFGMDTFSVYIFSEWDMGTTFLATLDEELTQSDNF